MYTGILNTEVGFFVIARETKTGILDLYFLGYSLSLVREAAKKSSFISGRATKRGGGKRVFH